MSGQGLDDLLDEVLLPSEAGKGPRMLLTLNLDHVVNLRINPAFRAAYAFAWRITIDGAPLYSYARAVGLRVRERVTGADLFASLLDRWNAANHRLFFVVSSDAAAESMARRLRQQGFAADQIDFVIPPFGFEQDAKFSRDLAARIRKFRQTHLIMGVGAPKSEIWVHANSDALGDMKVLCVGAAVEFAVGLKRRAPKWMRSAGLEWLFRVATEPRRLFRRYFISSFGFLLAIVSDQRSGGLRVR